MRPVCLDLTRLISRFGRGPDTGIDRVERAWLRVLLDSGQTSFGLIRTASGFSLLDTAGLAALEHVLTGAAPTPTPDPVARLSRGLTLAQRGAQTAVRQLAMASAPRPLLAGLLRKLPEGSLYLNLGHSNLTALVARTVSKAPQLNAAIMIHDLIPLTHPETQAKGGSDRFARKLGAALHMADRIICPSEATADDLVARTAGWDSRPRPLVAPLAPGLAGVTPAHPKNTPARYFVVLGTIEPRKNLGFLLDLVEALGDRAPHLVIIGRRGWASPEFFARLDRLKARMPQILEFNDLTDPEVAGWLVGAEALLHPSLAEGFGLPPAEAIALGTPAVCAPLPVYREILGDLPIYAELDDGYHWKQILLGQFGVPQARTRIGRDRAKGLPLPTWPEHVNRVLRALA